MPKKTDLIIYRDGRVERREPNSNNYWVSVTGFTRLKLMKCLTGLGLGQELTVYWRHGRWIIHHIEPLKKD